MSTVSVGDDVIDSRDVDARIVELQDELADTPFADPDHGAETLRRVISETPEEVQACFQNWDESTADELIGLIEFKEAAEPCTSEWEYGSLFIKDGHFEDYARELAEEIGAINSDASWPNNCIDWELASDELKSDYTAFEVNGNTYHTRG